MENILKTGVQKPDPLHKGNGQNRYPVYDQLNTVDQPYPLKPHISVFIIQQIVTLSKYGHDALDICHP